MPPSSLRDVSQNFPTPSLPHSSSPSPFSLHLSSFLPLHSHTTTPVLPHTTMLRPAPTTSATSALARTDQAMKQRIRSGPFLLITQSGGMLNLAIWRRCPVWRVLHINQSGNVCSMASLADATVWQSGDPRILAITYQSGAWSNLARQTISLNFRLASPRR